MTVHAKTRAECIDILNSALNATVLLGMPATNVPFLMDVLTNKDFRSGIYDTGLVANMKKGVPDVKAKVSKQAAATIALLWRWALNYNNRTSFRHVKGSFRNVSYRNPSLKVDVCQGAGESAQVSRFDVSYSTNRKWSEPGERGPQVVVGSGNGLLSCQRGAAGTEFVVGLLPTANTGLSQNGSKPIIFEDKAILWSVSLYEDDLDSQQMKGGEIRATVGKLFCTSIYPILANSKSRGCPANIYCLHWGPVR
jgi:hypothetical protein